MSQKMSPDSEPLTAEAVVRKSVNPEYQGRFEAIVGCIEAVCAKHLQPLGDEYAAVCQLLAALCCLEGSPAVRGRAKAESWAAGILWAVGTANFLADSSCEPTMTGKQLAAACGVSQATMQARCREIREGLEFDRLDPRLALPSLLAENPLIWMVTTDAGLLFDVRDAPREVQEQAHQAGLIPYIPADGAPAKSASSPLAIAMQNFARLTENLVDYDGPAPSYRLKITLKNVDPAVWRRIDVPDCPLDELHEIIQTAMGWTDSHLHEFAAGKRRFVMADDNDFNFGFGDAGVPEEDVWISDLVEEGVKRLQYTYDFGDGWEHEIKIEKAFPPSEDRTVTCRDGASACPPEDCGGPWGYADFLAALNDPQHERHEEIREWHGGDFDPAQFDLEEVNRVFANW